MGQRGRRSAASLDALRVDGSPAPLEPREGAPTKVRAIFLEIVESVSTKHFRSEDGYLVEQYAQAIALARQAYGELAAQGPVIDGKASPWVVVLEKAHRSSVALCARLRLAPQSRLDPKTAARESRSNLPKPWEAQ